MQQDKRNSREREETLTAEPKAKTEGGRQTMGVRRNGRQEMMHGMDKMDTEGNYKEGKLKIWMEVGLGWVFTRLGKIMVLDGGRSEMVVNSGLEDLEVRMRLKKMWKLVPQVEKRGTNWWK